MTEGHVTFPTQFFGKMKFFNQIFFLKSSDLQKIAQKWGFYNKNFVFIYFFLSAKDINITHTY